MNCTNQQINGRLTLTVEECAKFLGIGRSASYTLARHAEENGSPFKVIRIGGRLLVSRKSFNDYLKANGL